LPHGIQAQAARHDGIAGEVAVEEPEIRRDIEFSQDFTLAVLAAMVVDLDDAIHHQHVGGGQLAVTFTK
jgi:hypothetical protein